MTDKIKELAEKAGLKVHADGEIGPAFHGSVSDGYKKFAELIIQECIGTVENMSPGYQDYRNQIEDAFRRDCVIEIKYLFSIKD